jgi:prepilin-type processing-associated H-X9-DG protein
LRTRIVGFADGHVEGIGPLKYGDDAATLLTRAGGDTIEDDYQVVDKPPTEPVASIVHWDHVWGVTVWLALVLLPGLRGAHRRIWAQPLAAETGEEAAAEN